MLNRLSAVRQSTKQQKIAAQAALEAAKIAGGQAVAAFALLSGTEIFDEQGDSVFDPAFEAAYKTKYFELMGDTPETQKQAQQNIQQFYDERREERRNPYQGVCPCLLRCCP
jgi:peroxiredoxin family protein